MNSSNITSPVADEANALLDQTAATATEETNGLLAQVPDSVKEASDKALGAFKNLTTTQKVVGGALLAAGLAYLVAPKKKGKAKRKAAALDELLLFVNDRIEGYKRAVDETKDGDLRAYYQQLVSQSRQFADELNRYLTREGGERETGTTFKGKLYRKLMDAQAVVTARDEKAILAANLYGEKWAIKAYKKTLRRKALKGDIREAVRKQFAQSKKTYKKLKQLAAQQ
ncbi:PA2169 family four-helix-bundle protein [Hymenobacter sp. DH14]|uniref:PA2169 family four-helix-bundle protein n=1 Tax=Hymenobacter cyanobacteriorum TaxID=2926463 RepID=A0A9X1VGL8_9BACT|nr:PA2169 family four-helix-bundle protein [Hymenobacter cyanobacteriorum]MCI1187773.1 PA2169 family four-helix-bundle protein [Hymenobacter cyanobacteriorum]